MKNWVGGSKDFRCLRTQLESGTSKWGWQLAGSDFRLRGSRKEEAKQGKRPQGAALAWYSASKGRGHKLYTKKTEVWGSEKEGKNGGQRQTVPIPP